MNGFARRLALLAPALLLLAAQSPEPTQTSVGLPSRVLQLVLPGTELEALPIDSNSPIVLRVLATWPHGSEFRYDLEFYGLDPGEYDLARWLRRKDGTSSAELPAVPVRVVAKLGPEELRPNALEVGALPRVGGYRTLLIVAGALWVLGLVAILLVGRRRRAAVLERARPRTLAEELRPLVEAALAGRLDRAERAALELRLFEHWRRKLRLEGRSPLDSVVELRAHPEAGELLRKLEDWLHRPDPPADVDLRALLAPYEAVTLEESGAARAAGS